MSKKGTKSAKEVRQYNTGDPVLGKMRGYPPWPGIIVDPADVPQRVQDTQPPNKKAASYCILFFPQGDYGWLGAKELSLLQRHEIEAFLADDSKKRNGELRNGYRIALDPAPWLADRQAAVAAEQEEAENAQVDQLASDEDADAPASGDDGEEADPDAMDLDVGLGLAEGKKAKKSKAAAPARKRKRESEAGDTEAGKTKAAAKTKKATEPKTKKAAAEKEKKPRKNGTKSKTAVESEDEATGNGPADGADAPAGSSKKGTRDASPPPAKKARRDKEEEDESKAGDAQSVKVRDWRHKLQKTFLSNKGVPKSEAMVELDALFTTVEQYDSMTIEQLQFSKIGKVMRHIAALEDDKIPPRDAEFQFRARAKGLVDKWHRILNANKVGGGVTSPVSAGPVSGKLNGGAKSAAKESAKVDGEEAKAEKEGEAKTGVEEGVTGIDLNGQGADSPAVPAADAPTTTADAPPTTEAQPAGTADAEGEHDADANAEAEDASTHVEDVVMTEA